jgi:3,4-dihydroxy 2-butanone 4-phosphate synthase/GTP cyclohydrolase II
MRMIEEEEKGIILYLRQEGRGIGLKEKLKTYNLQDNGFDTVDANIELGHKAEERRYDVAARMLEMLGVNSIRLLSNNPDKVLKLERLGVQISERIPIEPKVNIENLKYLTTKVERMGHILDTDELHPFLPEIDDVIRFLKRSIERKVGIPFFTLLNIRSLNGKYPDLDGANPDYNEISVKVLKERIAQLHDALLIGPEEIHNYQGYRDLIGPIRKILIFDPKGEVNLSHPDHLEEELDIKFLHLGNLSKEREKELENNGFVSFDISNGKGEISVERIIDILPTLQVFSLLTEGANELGKFLVKRSLIDVQVHVLIPKFIGKEIEGEDIEPEMGSVKTVTLDGVTVYYSSK